MSQRRSHGAGWLSRVPCILRQCCLTVQGVIHLRAAGSDCGTKGIPWHQQRGQARCHQQPSSLEAGAERSRF